MTILFFDTETTGIKTPKNPSFVPKLVQLGAISYDTDLKRVIAEINIIISGAGEIPPEASNVHGISTEVARRYCVDKRAAEAIFAQLVKTADRVVAHNIAFDLDIIKDNMPVASAELDTTEHYCTMLASRDIVQVPFTEKQLAYFASQPDKKDGDYKAPHLSETFRHFFGHDFDGAHDAMADVRACRDVYFAIQGNQS